MNLIQPLSCVLLVLAILLAACGSAPPAAPPESQAWVRHTIDDSSRGADGVRLHDVKISVAIHV